jgi:cobalt-zinc-cadmium efflux system outer membrane protein
MLIRVQIALGIALLTALVCVPVHGQELAERDAVRMFLTRSPSARESRSGTAIVEAQTRSWWLWPNPQASFDHEGAGLTQISRVEQPLPLNGRLGFLRQAGASAVRVAEMQSEHSLWRQCSDMRRAFYGLLLGQERERLVGDAIRQLQEVLRILRERETQGEGSRFDRLRAEREESELQAELVSAQAETAQSRSRLVSFLDTSVDPVAIHAQGDFGGAKEIPSLPELIELALESRQDYQAEQQQQEQFRWQERAADRLRIPDPAFTVGFKRAETAGGIHYGPYIGFSVSLPVFDRGKTRVAELEAEMRRSSYRREVLDQRIQAEVTGAFEALRMRSRAAAEYRLRFEEQGSELERIAQTAYQEGEIGILELLDAYRVHRQSSLRALELSAASKQAEIELERAAGKPVLNPEVLP